MTGLLIAGGILLIIIFWYISANNKLVALKNNRENAFADIDVQLKQRHDLIPQLLGAVKGYMDHEKETFTRITEARSKAMNAGYNQYAPMLGVLKLREAIAQKFDVLYQSTYNPENEIVITAGATQAIFSIITAFINTSDEVIMFKPAYDCYEPAIQLNGGKAVPCN